MTEIKEIVEKVPCGESITIQYFEDGKLVRQDVKIIVDAANLTLFGETGK